jgi:DNA-binding response OmpR family regulator
MIYFKFNGGDFMKKILVIEDDDFINGMLCDLLIQNEYNPTAAFSGTEGILCFNNYEFDLVLLDLMLPGKVGNDVLAEIREKSNVPIIALTAIIDKESIVKILKSGANDYITKPFDNDELLARIEVQLRNFNTTPKEIITFKNIVLDLNQFDAFSKEKAAELSKREFEILKLMISNPKKVFTKNNIYETVWNNEFLGDDNTINVHISKIRSKLNKIDSENEYIQTVWGIGFKMQE